VAEARAQFHEIAAVRDPRRGVRVPELVEGRRTLALAVESGTLRCPPKPALRHVAMLQWTARARGEHVVTRAAVVARELVLAERRDD